MSMKLTQYEQEMLDGVHGEAKKLAMEGLVGFGEAVGAKEMVKVSFIHYIGCQKGLPKDSKEYQQFEWGQGLVLEPFWEMGAKATTDPNVVCTCDPYVAQIDAYEKEGMPWNNKYFKMSLPVINAVREGYYHMQKTGWLPTYSCTPHFNSAFPIHGEYAASCESSCACYLNSVLGVKTNRESAVIAPYATITGCISKYGMLLDENRVAKVIYELDDDIKNNIVDDPADAGLYLKAVTLMRQTERCVIGCVVRHDELHIHSPALLRTQRVDAGPDASFLIASGNDDGNGRERHAGLEPQRGGTAHIVSRPPAKKVAQPRATRN